MNNPWNDIPLSDYENHMSLDSVGQLQSLNKTMKNQLSDYDVSTVIILGIAGGNGLEHINEKYKKVFCVDINKTYLQAVRERYKNLNDSLVCLNLDIINESDELPEAELLIADLLIEYTGYDAFVSAVKKADPRYVSCVIQINTNETEWVSDSPYIHSFDSLDDIHDQIYESSLTEAMDNIGYRRIKSISDELPNNKRLLRIDYMKGMVLL